VADKTVGKRIRRAREKAGLSQVQLAKRVGVTRASVYNWEEGLTDIRNDKMPALAAALGVHPSKITPFGGDPDNEALARVVETLDPCVKKTETAESTVSPVWPKI
jgi:transcriptional regulator with XRE-family HTH domain